jgi:hypothetical protein
MAEDFTTYTEEDPNNRISTTSTRATFTGIARNEDAWLYIDKGVNHFDGDFEHLFQAKNESNSGPGICGIWSLTNDLDERRAILLGGKPELTVVYLGAGQTYLIEVNSSASYVDIYASTQGTLYYYTVDRDESVSFGTLTCKIYTDAPRTVLVDTLTVALHEKVDFRYYMPIQTFNDANASTVTGYVENMDFQEAVVTGFPFFFGDQ